AEERLEHFRFVRIHKLRSHRVPAKQVYRDAAAAALVSRYIARKRAPLDTNGVVKTLKPKAL
ncbi:MAG: hypothetical protein M3O62_06670, partial [Pseudomonadota bacterium]|nr:hypothetical protein [Pseudomonadota bacterium]